MSCLDNWNNYEPTNNLRVKTAVYEAIAEAWPHGIQESGDSEVAGLRMHDIKMRGRPWFNAEDDINGTRGDIQHCQETAM